jgi:hypothetical protein
MTDPTNPVSPSGDRVPESPAVTPAAAPAAAPLAARKRSTRWLTPTLAIVAALAVGMVGGVFIGRSGAAHAGPGTFARGQFAGGDSSQIQGGSGQGGGTGRAFAGGGFTTGKITAIDGTTITVKAPDGTLKKVSTTAKTRVSKTTTSSVDELKKGETVTVIGATGSDGTVAATTISQGAGLRGGFGARPGGAPTPNN